MSYIGPVLKRYAYSTARVKAMESTLIKKEEIEKIINSKDQESIISILLQTDYKKELDQLGGKEKGEILDFALSKNLASNVGKLITITPMEDKSITRAVLGKWDIYNIELAIDAKARKIGFEEISKYIIDYGPYNMASLKEAYEEESVEGLISKMMINSPYKEMLSQALEAYWKRNNAIQASITIDKLYYQKLGLLMPRIRSLSNGAAKIIKLDIDMKNILMLMRSKKYNMPFNEIKDDFIPSGSIALEELRLIYENSKNEEEVARSLKVFDLSKEAELYKKEKRLFIFEIGMRSRIFKESISVLSHTLLSFGTLLAYAYIKESEVLMLRILSKGREYGLPEKELIEMMPWMS